MAVVDPVTERHSTFQQSPVTARPKRGCVLHHGATTSIDAIIQMETSGSREVSSNRVIKDTRNAKIADDPNYRAWSLADAYWDSVLSSVECANQSTQGWTISDASHEMLARQVAWWAERDGFYPHRNGHPTTWTVFGHREIYSIFGDSYATACPGGMNLDWVTTRAQQILAGAIVPAKPKGTFVLNSYHFADRNARDLAPGKATRLKGPSGADINIVGRVCPVYDISPHVKFSGLEEGDELSVRLVWDNATSKKVSPHYDVRAVAGKDGVASISPSFKRGVQSGDRVFLEVSAPDTNKGTGKLVWIDSDAYAYDQGEA